MTEEVYDTKQHGYVIDDIRQWLRSMHDTIVIFGDAVEWQHAGLLLEYIHTMQQALITIQGRLFYLNRLQALMDIQHKGLYSYNERTPSYDVVKQDQSSTRTDVSIEPTVLETETLESLDDYFRRTQMH
jgi:hypothetical protein